MARIRHISTSDGYGCSKRTTSAKLVGYGRCLLLSRPATKRRPKSIPRKHVYGDGDIPDAFQKQLRASDSSIKWTCTCASSCDAPNIVLQCHVLFSCSTFKNDPKLIVKQP